MESGSLIPDAVRLDRQNALTDHAGTQLLEACHGDRRTPKAISGWEDRDEAQLPLETIAGNQFWACAWDNKPSSVG